MVEVVQIYVHIEKPSEELLRACFDEVGCFKRLRAPLLVNTTLVGELLVQIPPVYCDGSHICIL